MEKENKREKVIEKVLKLLNKEEGSNDIGSFNEASTAAMLAQKLIDKFNIEQHELKKSKEEDLRVSQVNLNPESWGFKKNEGFWIRDLFTVISNYNMTKVIFYPHTKTLVIIGESDKIENTLFLGSQLVIKLKGLCKISTKANTSKADNQNRYRRDYYYGAVLGISSKFREMREHQEAQDKAEAEKEGVGITAVAIIHNEAIDTYIEDTYGELTSGRRQKRKQGKGVHMGFQDGKNVNINQGVENTGNHSQIT